MQKALDKEVDGKIVKFEAWAAKRPKCSDEYGKLETRLTHLYNKINKWGQTVQEDTAAMRRW